MVRREKLYDQALVEAIQSTPEGKEVVLPDPKPAPSRQQQNTATIEQRKPEQGEKEITVDWGLAMRNPVYRKEVEQQLKDARAAGVQLELGHGPQQRLGAGGRGR